MSYESVRYYFDTMGLGNRLTVREQIGDTVNTLHRLLTVNLQELQKQCPF